MTDPVAPTGVDHVAINVADVPAGIAFYTEKIGLVQNFTRPDFGFAGAWLDAANGQQVHLIEAAVPDNVGQHFALAFDDLAAVVAELRVRGLLVSDPVDVGTTGRKQAFTADPWGNGIELHERPQAEPAAGPPDLSARAQWRGECRRRRPRRRPPTRTDPRR